jgi:hypothetical protein
MAHLTCFNATALERTLAVQLGVPLYGFALADLGSKSGGREVLRRTGVALPDGFERLRDRRADPGLRRAVVKLEEGFPGEGKRGVRPGARGSRTRRGCGCWRGCW